MKILILDDHLLFVEGLKLVLNKLPFSFDVITAFDIEAGEKAVEEYGNRIDLALVDLNLPMKGGVLFVRTLRSKKNLIPTIIISAEEDNNRIKKGIDAGAQGFIPKTSSIEVMLFAIQSVLEGGDYFPKFMQLSYEEGLNQNNGAQSYEFEEKRLGMGVSNRQYETLLLMARGLSNKEVAERLYLSEHTVKSHASVLFQLLDASNRTECVLRAKQLKIIG